MYMINILGLFIYVQ